MERQTLGWVITNITPLPAELKSFLSREFPCMHTVDHRGIGEYRITVSANGVLKDPGSFIIEMGERTGATVVPIVTISITVRQIPKKEKERFLFSVIRNCLGYGVGIKQDDKVDNAYVLTARCPANEETMVRQFVSAAAEMHKVPESDK